MKRFLLPSLLAVAWTQLASGQVSSEFNNSGTYNIPPNNDPIAATNFVNSGEFTVTLNPDQASYVPSYFQTSGTLNYTNTGTMTGNPGFIFGYYPNNPGAPVPGVSYSGMAANFVNQANGLGGGIINCSGASTIDLGLGFVLSSFSNTKVVVAATNIVNSGTISLDSSQNFANNQIIFFTANQLGALLSLTGENVDLRGGKLALTSSTTNNGALFVNSTFGVSSLDYGYGSDTNGIWNPGLDLTQNTALSSYFLTVNSLFFQRMFLSNSIPYSTTVQTSSNTIVTRSIFLQDTSPNVTKNAYFQGTIVGQGAAHVEWAAPFVDPVTGVLTTNYLYLSDFYAALTATSVTNAFFAPNGIPANLSFAQGTTPLIIGTPEVPAVNFPMFPDAVVSNLYSYADVQLIPTLNSTNAIYGANITNLPQRIQISASRTLNLADAQISGPDYLELTCTNQFEGNAGLSLSAPLSDINLGVTNGFLTISNFMRPTLPLWSGRIQAFTARWFDVDTVLGITNDNRVLLINSQVFPTTVPQIQNLTLHATNTLTISDHLNVYAKVSIDATTLTLTTNGESAYSTAGALNFLSSKVIWSDSLPNLKYLTNWGTITAGNLMNFAGNVFNPYSDSGTPYQTFINHGVITNGGTIIVANYFLNDGVIKSSPLGNFSLRANGAFLTNGLISSPAGAGNISLTCNSLVVSNHMLQSGATLKLAVSNCITDGYALFNQFGHTTTTNAPINGGVTNGNFWTAGGAFSMPVKTKTGDLLGTTVSNFSTAFSPVFSQWAGQNRGCAPTGYVNNLAIGRLILNGENGGRFAFTGTGTSNAVYVDLIDFQGSTTNLEASGLPAITINPNLRIYYAQATAGGISIAEKLSGRNGGGFIWVSNYAGIFSSTNMQYADGSWHTLNQALVESEGIDSNGDSVVNRFDSSPIPTNWVFDVVVTNAPCDCDTNLPITLVSVMVQSSPAGRAFTVDGTNYTSAQIFSWVAGSSHTVGTTSPQGGTQYVWSNWSDSLAISHTIAPLSSASYTVTFTDTFIVPEDAVKLPPLPVSPLGGVVANFFNVTKGSYAGLFYQSNSIALKSAGYFTASTTAKGSFSAELRIAGKSYSFSGQFNSAGFWTKSNAIKFKNANNTTTILGVALQLDSGGGGQIIGTVTDGTWTAGLLAQRSVYNKKTNPAPKAGSYTFAIPGDANGGIYSPAGHGVATLKVDGNGGLSLNGSLGDGATISRSSAVSQQGNWPLYASLYDGKGFIIGWVQFAATADSDMSGTNIWLKTAGVSGKLYKLGFTNEVESVGSAYTPGAFGSGNAAIRLSGGNLPSTIVHGVVLNSSLKAVNQAPNKLNLTFTGSSGAFKGSLANPGWPLAFQGVWLEKRGYGVGFFPGTNQSGQVVFGRLP